MDYFGTGTPGGAPPPGPTPSPFAGTDGSATSPFADVYDAPPSSGGYGSAPSTASAVPTPAFPPTWAAAPGPVAPTAWAPVPVVRSGLPLHVLLLGLGGVLLALSSVLPWVEVLVLDLSGLKVEWGVAALVGGLLALLCAADEATGMLGSGPRPLARLGALLGGLAGAGAAVAVWLKVREASNDFASGFDEGVDQGFSGGFEPSGPDALGSGTDELGGSFAEGFEDFGRTLAEAFQPSAGVGLWLALVAGVAVAAGAVLALRRP